MLDDHGFCGDGGCSSLGLISESLIATARVALPGLFAFYLKIFIRATSHGGNAGVIYNSDVKA